MPALNAQPIHAATRTACRAVNSAHAWVTDPQVEASLSRAERILNEIATYATLRADPEVPAGQAQARLTQFLDNLLEMRGQAA